MHKVFLFLIFALLPAFLFSGCGESTTVSETAGENEVSVRRAQLEAGIAKLQQGEFEAAVKLLQKAVEESPESAAAHCNLGIVYEKLKQPGKAISSFRKAADLSDNDPRPLEFLGQTLSRLKRWDEARTAFDQAYQRSPLSSRILTSMACVEIHAGKIKQARSFLTQALALDPDYPPALYNLALLNKDKLNNPQEAVKYFEKYLSVADDNQYTQNAKQFLESGARGPAVGGINQELAPPQAGSGVSHVSSEAAKWPLAPEGRRGSQIEVLQSEPQPGLADSSALVSSTQGPGIKVDSPKKASLVQASDSATQAPPARATPEPATSDKTEARRDTRTALKIWADGLEYHNKGNLDKAISCYKRALEHDENCINASYNLGLAYKAKDDILPAKDAFIYTLNIKPDMAQAHYMLGVILRELKNNGKAVEHLNKALKIKPDYAKAHYLLGLLYRAEKRHELAKKHFERYVRLEPEEPSARKIKEWLKSISNQ